MSYESRMAEREEWVINELKEAFKHCAPFDLSCEVEAKELRAFSGTWRRVIAGIRKKDPRSDRLLGKIGVTYVIDGAKITLYRF